MVYGTSRQQWLGPQDLLILALVQTWQAYSKRNITALEVKPLRDKAHRHQLEATFRSLILATIKSRAWYFNDAMDVVP